MTEIRVSVFGSIEKLKMKKEKRQSKIKNDTEGNLCDFYFFIFNF